jgi:hypothetical protein
MHVRSCQEELSRMMYSGTSGWSRIERGERVEMPSSEIVSVSCDFI